MKLMPASTERLTMASTSSCGSWPMSVHRPPFPPKVIVPRQSSDTLRPVLPNKLYFIICAFVNSQLILVLFQQQKLRGFGMTRQADKAGCYFVMIMEPYIFEGKIFSCPELRLEGRGCYDG